MVMSKLIMLFALCVLPVLASKDKFVIFGRVYCDTCHAGYETDVTPDIACAKVKIQCRKRDDMDVKYVAEGITNSTGLYKILIEGDRGDDICDVELVSSTLSDCCEPDPGSKGARVISATTMTSFQIPVS